MRCAGFMVAITLLGQVCTSDSVFEEREEAIVYTYSPEAEQQGQISKLPVAASFAAFVGLEKAEYARDHHRCKELEKRGDVFWVESGTRCLVIRGGGMSVGPIVRSVQEIRLLQGQQEVRAGWIEAKHLRKNSRIRVEPPERYTDETWGSARPLALAHQAQDKVIFRELIAARERSLTAAKALPRGDRQRQVRYHVFRSEHRAVLDRYDLDEATALRILDWGKQGGWPTGAPEKSP